jgi:hypothetical protein
MFAMEIESVVGHLEEDALELLEKPKSKFVQMMKEKLNFLSFSQMS